MCLFHLLPQWRLREGDKAEREAIRCRGPLFKLDMLTLVLLSGPGVRVRRWGRRWGGDRDGGKSAVTVKREWIVFQTSAPGLKALMGQLLQRKKMRDVCHLSVLLAQGQHSTGLFRNSSEDIKTMA